MPPHDARPATSPATLGTLLALRAALAEVEGALRQAMDTLVLPAHGTAAGPARRRLRALRFSVGSRWAARATDGAREQDRVGRLGALYGPEGTGDLAATVLTAVTALSGRTRDVETRIRQGGRVPWSLRPLRRAGEPLPLEMAALSRRLGHDTPLALAMRQLALVLGTPDASAGVPAVDPGTRAPAAGPAR